MQLFAKIMKGMTAVSCLLVSLTLSTSVDAFAIPTRTTVMRKYSESPTVRNMIQDPSDLSQMLFHFNTLADASTADVIEPTYSKASYYTTLGLYVMSFPGLWSQVKRSTTAKLKRKTFISDGEVREGGKDLRQQAGEIMAYMKANNYDVVEAGEVITFRGLVQKSTSQAFFLVFCTLIGMASLALVLEIQFQGLSLPFIGEPNWFYLCLIAPYAGLYYWQSGDRVDDVKVKLASNDDDTENEITIEGNDEELERMWRALELREKGMVKVEGLLETAA
mmetsp:Transcript_9974/g.11064  ORF Transcript_9974/g.11064 Transcript_9974/m.11064 type:complete len:277 (+) Transcript_9974:93-923(+)